MQRALVPGGIMLAIGLWLSVGSDNDDPHGTDDSLASPKGGSAQSSSGELTDEEDKRAGGDFSPVPGKDSLSAGNSSLAPADRSAPFRGAGTRHTEKSTTTHSEVSWTSMPALGRASGPARSAQYKASFELISDSCGDMPIDSDRDFETGLVDGALVIQFDNASWECELTDYGRFECPTLEEAKTEADGRTPHIERSARGVWRLDGSIEIQVQTRTWCEGVACEASPCEWSFGGVASLTT